MPCSAAVSAVKPSSPLPAAIASYAQRCVQKNVLLFICSWLQEGRKKIIQKSRMGEGELLPPPAGQLREGRRWACFVTAPKCSHLSKSLAIFDYLYYFVSISPLFSPLYAQTMLQRHPLKYCCRDIDLYVKLEMMEGGEFSAEKQRKTQTTDSRLLIP